MTIKVGDKVYVKGAQFPTKYDVIHVHQKDSRVYYVVAFFGDKPSVYEEKQLEKVPEVTFKDYRMFDTQTGDFNIRVKFEDKKPVGVELLQTGL